MQQPHSSQARGTLRQARQRALTGGPALQRLHFTLPALPRALPITPPRNHAPAARGQGLSGLVFIPNWE